MADDHRDMLVSTYDQIVEEYVRHEYDSPAMEPHYQKFMQGLPVGGRILDVGCGPGQAAKRFCEKKYKVLGLDLSEKMLEYARTNTPAAHFLQMDVENISLTETFNGIWAAFVLVHIPERRHIGILKRFYDLLEPGGLLYLGMLEGEGEKVVQEPYRRDLQQFFVFSSREQIEKNLLYAGFSILSHTTQDCDEEGDLFRLSSTYATKSTAPRVP